MATITAELQWIALCPSTDDPTGGTLWADEPYPPREILDFEGLMRSIREIGVLSPILVRNREARLQVVCGYRRYLAARKAGLHRIPALVRTMDDAEAIRCYHEENLFHNDASRFVEALDPAGQILPGQERRCLDPAWAVKGGGRDARGSLPLLDLTSNAEIAAGGSIDAAVQEAVERILVRSRAFFDEVRMTRRINVPRTEILLDSVLELLEGNATILLRGFSRPVDGDVVAPHSVLVTQLCAGVARFLGWDEATTRNLVLGGFLHDVGMAFVRETASLAAGSLTPADVQTIHSHTRIGCALIAGTQEWSGDVANMAIDHHERWNGTGYPDQKVGTEIPFLARLLGLLDTYAALITPRPHRAALDHAYARERLVGALEKGLWDPSLKPIILEALPSLKLRGADLEGPELAGALTKNSVELRGDLVTMLAKGST